MDHEKLDVYRVSLEVVRSVGSILKSSPSADRVIRDQILRSSTSILLNIAEGTGKRSPADRRRYYEIARGSAMETGAALDVLLVLEYASDDQVSACKAMLRRVISMLTRMTEPALPAVQEEEAEYEPGSGPSSCPYIPEDAKWYLADLVIEFRFEGEDQRLLHINTVLVRADSPEEAYQAALKLGGDADMEYANSDGVPVRCRFAGLRDLMVIYDPLEHGSELLWTEEVSRSDEETASFVRSKTELGIFCQRPSLPAGNYLPKSIADRLQRHFQAGEAPDV